MQIWVYLTSLGYENQRFRVYSRRGMLIKLE